MSEYLAHNSDNEKFTEDTIVQKVIKTNTSAEKTKNKGSLEKELTSDNENSGSTKSESEKGIQTYVS